MNKLLVHQIMEILLRKLVKPEIERLVSLLEVYLSTGEEPKLYIDDLEEK